MPAAASTSSRCSPTRGSTSPTAAYAAAVSPLSRRPGRAGPALIASNHLSFSDSIFMPLMVKRRVTFIAKSEYFTGRGLKGWLSKAFFAGTGQIPVDRSGGRAAQAALDTGKRVLAEGKLFGI